MLEWTLTYSPRGLDFWHQRWKQPSCRKADESNVEAPQPVTKQTLLSRRMWFTCESLHRVSVGWGLIEGDRKRSLRLMSEVHRVPSYKAETQGKSKGTLGGLAVTGEVCLPHHWCPQSIFFTEWHFCSWLAEVKGASQRFPLSKQDDCFGWENINPPPNVPNSILHL